jgi:hypothetical protein
MVKLLFIHETIYGDEVDMLIEGKSVEEVSALIQAKKDEKDKIAAEHEKMAKEAATKPLGNPSDVIVPEGTQMSFTVSPENGSLVITLPEEIKETNPKEAKESTSDVETKTEEIPEAKPAEIEEPKDDDKK